MVKLYGAKNQGAQLVAKVTSSNCEPFFVPLVNLLTLPNLLRRGFLYDLFACVECNTVVFMLELLRVIIVVSATNVVI